MWFQPSNIRILLTTLLFVSVFFAPSWMVAVLAIALALRWRAWEVVAAGIFMDFLWLPSFVFFTTFDVFPLATLASIILVVALEPLRRQLLLDADAV